MEDKRFFRSPGGTDKPFVLPFETLKATEFRFAKFPSPGEAEEGNDLTIGYYGKEYEIRRRGPAPRRRAGQVLRYPRRLLYSSSAAKIAARINLLIQWRRH
jgi:hypothetical protein